MQYVFLQKIKNHTVVAEDLIDFINEAILLIHRLRTPFFQFRLSPPVDKFTLIDCLGRAMFMSRRSQACNLPTPSEPHWHDYVRGLCDALFGLWSVPISGIYHSERTGMCIESFLGSVNLEPRGLADNIPSLEKDIFVASLIESRGPFRFRKTNNLGEHLLIKKNQILIYTDWQKWAGIRKHSVLRDGGNALTMFDHLVSIGRYGPTGRATNNRLPICRLSIDLQLINLLIFFQDLPRDLETSTKRRRLLAPLRNRLTTILAPRSSSRAIANGIGLTLSADEIQKRSDILLGYVDGDWESILNTENAFRLYDAFKDRVDKYHQILSTWKPKSVWELRYPGYGGVDPVSLYGFYFAAIFGLITLLTLGLTVAQTFSGFKALNVNQAPKLT